MLTHKRLVEILAYDRTSGFFFPKSRITADGRVRSARKEPAGSVSNGYRSIEIDGVTYRANRLAWLYVTGSWPDAVIDHRDGDTLNDRWSNLRSATRSQNGANAKRRADNTSGFKGVSFCRRLGKFKAYIRKDGKYIHLGCFGGAELAHAAYRAAADKHFGKFARAA